MPKVVSPHLTTLVFDALLASFWRKNALQRFVRDCAISPDFVATFGPEESKRMFLDRLFAELQRHPKGGMMFLRMARALAEQTVFPDLQDWEDSEEKITAAQRAVQQLRQYLSATGTDATSAERRQASAEREAKLVERSTLAEKRFGEFKSALEKLAVRIGSQGAGYDFQTWFYELMDFCEVISRRPYVANERQIDGTITVDGTTYLVELKFTTAQVSAPDVDSLAQKVTKKADNTMGVMVSMSGYSGVAIREASGPGSKLLLFDYNHIYAVLGGHDFSDLVNRVRRHASQTGQAYLAPASFGAP